MLMGVNKFHPWDVTPQEAIDIQQHLRNQVIRANRFGVMKKVAGVDVGFENDGTVTRAAVAVMTFPDLHLEETSILRCSTCFPYVPGLLSFREAPAILDALSKLATHPDLLMVDGQGIAHPRRMGIASHLGLLCNLPSIGVAKSLLVGKHMPVEDIPGAWQPLEDGDEVIGAVLRTKYHVKPVYVSIGHRLDLDTAIKYVMDCVKGYRLPEPVRQAHLLASSC
jgi:deoxyribonuclease V